ncbi:IFT57 [Cordylochernes scorpioides]|uniref:IFT57 n=1 Tax=Cordylochernes scorpioides TaxID=51811 RepID=A0ABY6LS19_9ARAC|nr:IFT57 [Cordylochernes scorpioides]
MGEEKRRELDQLVEASPGQAFISYLIMEDLLDKIKLLQSKDDSKEPLKTRPLNRHYFVLPTNPGEQFFTMVTLATWLIRRCGQHIEPPQELDDPNATISNILDILRKMNVAITFPPSRLKPGHGSEVLFILDRLADLALRHTHFSWKLAVHEKEEEVAATEEMEEHLVDRVEEEMMEEVDDDDEEDEDSTYLNFEMINKSSRHVIHVVQAMIIMRCVGQEVARPEDILESAVDQTEWRLEVERVLPQLKVVVHADSKDWRSHLEQLQAQRKDMAESLNRATTQLDRVATEAGRALEKLNSRERYLNQQLEAPLAELRTAQERLSAAKDRYRAVSGGVVERSRTLAQDLMVVVWQLTEELEQVKSEMEEQGSSMTDGTPLVKVRKALAQLKADISQMNVRIGVANHTLLQARLKEKGNQQRAASTPVDLVF